MSLQDALKNAGCTSGKYENLNFTLFGSPDKKVPVQAVLDLKKTFSK